MDDFSSPVSKNIHVASFLPLLEWTLLKLKFLQGSSNAFGYVATPSNYIAPGKRPLSSISPAMIEDKNGNFIFATGAAGGSRIIGANIQDIHHYIDQGLTPRMFLLYLYLPSLSPVEISYMKLSITLSISKHV